MNDRTHPARTFPASRLLAIAALGAVLPGSAGAVSRSTPLESAPVQVIRSSDLQLPSESIKEVLDLIPTAPAGGGAPAGNLGIGQPHSMILLNGVRVPRDAAAAVPLEAVERVEVLREGASALYGSDAVGGVVNLITRRDFDAGLDYGFGRMFGDLTLAAEYDQGCSVTAGIARPLPMWTGGKPFGGPLLERNTWFIPGTDTELKLPDVGWSTFGPSQATEVGGFYPFVYLDPTPQETLKAAVGTTPPSDPAFPAALFRGGIPPESTVLSSNACPDAIKAELKTLYEARNQAMADMVYYNDFRSSFPPDPVRTAEARGRRDAANAAIRTLLDQCTTPTAVTPVTTAAATGTTATPADAGTKPQIGLAFRDPLTKDKGMSIGAELRWDLSLRGDFGLPWSGPKDTETWIGLDAVRGFDKGGGMTTIDPTPELGANLGFDPQIWGGMINKLGAGTAMPDAPHAKWPHNADYLDWDMPGTLRFTLPLNLVHSYVVELGGRRPNIGLGSGDGLVPDPRDRFDPTVDGMEDKIDPLVAPYFVHAFNVDQRTYFVFDRPGAIGFSEKDFAGIRGATNAYENACAQAALPVAPGDPAYQAAGGKGSWGQDYDDQWAIKRVGLTPERDSAWAQVPDTAAPVVIGVIDTGLDWHHADIDWNNLWRNEDEVPGNARDDDNNGYVDDVVGWDFTGRSNHPWDRDGHGTFVAGIIAATRDNDTGIAGINPGAKIMVLKALNTFGRTRASYVAEAIAYGVDNGARILNLSLSGEGLPPLVQDAIRYAESQGVLVVVAAGNNGADVGMVFPAGLAGAMAVAATTPEDRRAGFSNWGPGISLAAPGVDVMSLRARRTDFMWNTGDVSAYRPGANVVGADRRYYRSTGTSFAAPIVTGVASLLLSRDPSLSAADVRRILEQSAHDIETPGVDQFTGYGLLDAKAALEAERSFFVAAAITGVTPVPRDNDVILEVIGTADADRFERAWIEYGPGEAPPEFERAKGELRESVQDGTVGEISARGLTSAKTWTLRLVTEHKNGRQREARFLLNLQ